MKLPSVVAMLQYRPLPKRVAFTRFNVFLRDRFRCQYCGNFFHAKDLTFEHVLPRSKGGATSWTNIVAACDPCNVKKDNKLDMKPIRAPFMPTPGELLDRGPAALVRFAPEEGRRRGEPGADPGNHAPPPEVRPRTKFPGMP